MSWRVKVRILGYLFTSEEIYGKPSADNLADDIVDEVDVDRIWVEEV